MHDYARITLQYFAAGMGVMFLIIFLIDPTKEFRQENEKLRQENEKLRQEAIHKECTN